MINRRGKPPAQTSHEATAPSPASSNPGNVVKNYSTTSQYLSLVSGWPGEGRAAFCVSSIVLVLLFTLGGCDQHPRDSGELRVAETLGGVGLERFARATEMRPFRFLRDIARISSAHCIRACMPDLSGSNPKMALNPRMLPAVGRVDPIPIGG